MVNELDVKEAARLGMHTRPLTTAVVQQHLADLGVDPEFGTHSHMRGLSGELLHLPPALKQSVNCASACGIPLHFLSFGTANTL